MAQAGHRYTVYPSGAFLGLAVCSSVLLAAYLTGLVLKLNGHSRVFGLVRLSDMDLERNIPTFFSTGLLMTGSFLFSSLWCVRRGVERRGHYLRVRDVRHRDSLVLVRTNGVP